MELLHVTPGLLLSADSRISQQKCFYAFLTGGIEEILSWLLMNTHRP